MTKKKKLNKSPKYVTRKFSAAEREKFEEVRTQIEQEVPPKSISAARIALAKLRNLRRNQNVTLTELARRTGMTKANLSRLENSGDNVTLKTLERYAIALGVELVIDITETPRRPMKV